MTYIGKNTNTGGCEQCNKLTSTPYNFNGLEFCSKDCAITFIFKKVQQIEDNLDRLGGRS